MGEYQDRVTSINFFTNKSYDKFDDQLRWSSPQVNNKVVETLTQWAAVMIQLRLTCMIIMKLVFTVFSLLSIISRNKFSLRVIHNFPNSLLAKTWFTFWGSQLFRFKLLRLAINENNKNNSPPWCNDHAGNETHQRSPAFMFGATSARKDQFDFVTLGKRSIEKIDFFLGNSPKQRTPPTHRYGLGLT